VLIVNPASGRGHAKHANLVEHCRERGIQTVIRQPGDTIAALARAAVEGGAEIIGMAGGDGSQAAVAAVAAEHDVPFVCVPAGTRNHFALALGLDRRDLIGALEAFVGGAERRIDLARVNDRVFVNNASMGLYGRIVQSPAYRDAKFRTAIGELPDLVGPSAERFDLRFTAPDGAAHSDAALLLVSNDPYLVDLRPGRRTRDTRGTRGTRGTMDAGTLGVVYQPSGPPLQRVREWTTTAFRVESAKPVELGLDGEAVTMDPPLVFESLPSALRVRVPR